MDRIYAGMNANSTIKKRCNPSRFIVRPLSIAFVLAQFADLTTTLIGLSLGLAEGNPLGAGGGMLACKLAVMVLGAVIFQVLPMPRLAWFVVALSAAPAVWNAAQIARAIL